MTWFESAVGVLAVAVIMDLIIGDPDTRFHPVQLLGLFVEKTKNLLFRGNVNGYVGGTILLTGTVLVAVGTGVLIPWGLFLWCPPVIAVPVAGVVLSLTFAIRSFADHTRPLVEALENGDLSTARETAAGIVGRETSDLSGSEVAKATVESLAEGFVDSVVGPLFWFLAGAILGSWTSFYPSHLGLTGAVLHRSINTLDAMVGYRNERFQTFGAPSARMDDLMNFVPARISLPFLMLGGGLLNLQPLRGVSVWFRDRNNHPSPNAGQSESFVAGLLDVQLGGPTTYSFGTVEKATMGPDSEPIRSHHVQTTIRLYLLSSGIYLGSTFLFLYVALIARWPALF